MTPMDENSTTALICTLTHAHLEKANDDYLCSENHDLSFGATNCHSPTPLPINSATVFLLRRAASMILRIVKEIDWNEGARALADLHSVLSSAISLHFYSLVHVLHVVSDFGVECSYYDSECNCTTRDAKMLMTSTSGCWSSCEPTMMGATSDNDSAFQSPALSSISVNNNDVTIVIEQAGVSQPNTVDVATSNDFEGIHSAGSIDQPLPTPTISQRDECSLGDSTVCSSCHEDENENIDDFLLRNAGIIDDYIANAAENPCHEVGSLFIGDLPQFSWMIVPTDPSEELTRQSSRSHIDVDDNIPESISICKSTAPSNSSLVDDRKSSCCNTPIVKDDNMIYLVSSQNDEDDRLDEVLFQRDDIERKMLQFDQYEDVDEDIEVDEVHDDDLPMKPAPHPSTESKIKRFSHYLSSFGH